MYRVFVSCSSHPACQHEIVKTEADGEAISEVHHFAPKPGAAHPSTNPPSPSPTEDARRPLLWKIGLGLYVVIEVLDWGGILGG